MKIIPLTQDKVALVDDEDYPWLNQWKWHANKHTLKNRLIWYAVRRVRHQGRQLAVYMHREIAVRAALPFSKEYDHWDTDGLNNQRMNLRPATRNQNRWNQCKQLNCTSRFKGVCWSKRAQKWDVRIRFYSQRLFLGRFVNETDAALAYNDAARRLFGEFALLNEI